MVQQLVGAIATAAARLEESVYPHAVIFPNYPRLTKFGFYSWGAKSDCTIMKYFCKRCTPQSDGRALKTDEDMTAASAIKMVFQEALT